MRFVLICLLGAILVLTSCADRETAKPVKTFYGPAHPEYTMDLTYDNQKHTIGGVMTVQFENNLDKTLKNIYFNLWPNADAFKEGEIKINRVRYNNTSSAFKVEQTKLDISEITLKPNEKATVEIDFVVTIPEGSNRFGWEGSSVSLGNWFPILAVYDHHGWALHPYAPETDSFYSLTGNFDVTLKTDEKQVIATTGQEVSEPVKKDGKVVHHYQAKDVRDFAIQMNETYHVKSAMEGKTKINVYYTDEQQLQGDEMLEAGRYALHQFNELYGDYPWPELDIVGMGQAFFAGMEYPQLVMISLKKDSGRDYIYLTTAHEIAHQWFYGAVGNDEFREPWLDESFATYASEDIMGVLDKLDNVVAPSGDGYDLDAPVSNYYKGKNDLAEDRDFVRMMYSYGAKTLYDLRQQLGDDLFYKGMRAYYKKMKFKVATTDDFIRIMEKTTGKNLTKFFKAHHIK
ncbi:M1 family metallopeptidase [Camelliibacillus cellulosilyticus]|uniref:M1 family metallopeptidase n=1 Tax=Camelliibacillus cellulosilyticus TaxID=2174486 RepID=A0ABV9GNF0_9BACL